MKADEPSDGEEAHVTAADGEHPERVVATTTYDRDRLVPEAAERVVEAARDPDCNFSRERECGFSPDGTTYIHHPRFCPRGRLIAALAEYDRARAVVRATAAVGSVEDDRCEAVLRAYGRALLAADRAPTKAEEMEAETTMEAAFAELDALARSLAAEDDEDDAPGGDL